MRIEHIAMWTRDLARCKRFYTAYFGVTAGPHYLNAAKGIAVVDGPRRTGDGYYESVIIDPDGNRIEICC